MSRRRLLMLVGGLVVVGCTSARNTEEAATSCTSCHGDASAGNAAPPIAANGATSTSDVTVGAHQAHLQPSPLRQPVSCTECHVVPSTVDAPGHIDKATADVVFGPLASTGGKTQPYSRSPDGTSATCTVYCHGAAFTAGDGSNHAPIWTRVDGSQAGCGTCHGIPPPPPHPATGNSIIVCSQCHPATVKPDGTIDVAGGKHIDGVVDVIGGGTCTACHGDSTRANAAIAAAPPRDTQGNTDPSAPGVGAHQAHLNPGPLAAAIACSECHTVPTDLTHATQPLVLTWGPVASAGTTPRFDPTALTCTNYCHGATLTAGTHTTPVWTAGAAEVTCGSCHGLPPTSGLHAGPHTGIPCGTCHGQGYSTTTVAQALHVNGNKDVGGPGSAITTYARPNCTPLCHVTRAWP